MKPIIIAACLFIGLVVSVVTGWSAGKWSAGDGAHATAAGEQQAVANAPDGTRPSAAPNSDQPPAADAANVPCDITDAGKACFKQVPDPLPVLPRAAANGQGVQPQDI